MRQLVLSVSYKFTVINLTEPFAKHPLVSAKLFSRRSQVGSWQEVLISSRKCQLFLRCTHPTDHPSNKRACVGVHSCIAEGLQAISLPL